MGVALAVVAEEMIDALIERTAAGIEEAHAPFAKGGGRVTRGLRDLRDRDGLVRQRQLAFGRNFVVAADRTVTGVQAGEKRRPARCANAGAAVRLQITRSLGGHLIDSRRLDQLLPVAPQVALGDVIAEDKDEIGLLIFRPLAVRREAHEGCTSNPETNCQSSFGHYFSLQ